MPDCWRNRSTICRSMFRPSTVNLRTSIRSMALSIPHYYRIFKGLVNKMVADLGTQSSNFVRLWNLTDVSLREGGLREFSHPTLGTLCFEQISFRPGGSGDWRLTILIPERKSDG
ncbi:hypothetical protein ACQAYK_03755 [Acidithiobacillus sp. AC3]